MKRVGLTILIFVAAFFFAAPEVAAQNDSPAVPAMAAFMALEKQAHEAYDKGDSKFFEGLLSDKFVAREGEVRLRKADFVDSVIGVKCDTKNRDLDEQWMAKVDADTYVISYRGTSDGTCTGALGKSMKIQSPSRAATVWIRNRGKWQAAFHGSNLIVDPKNVSLSAIARSSKAKRGNAITKTLAALEKTAWKAWKDHDFKKMDSLTANGLSFIDIFGNSYDNRGTILKTWASNVCKVKSVKITDAVAFSFSPTVALLTHIGTADGTCYGEKLGPIYGNSVYVKEGGGWKLAFTMNMPAM